MVDIGFTNLTPQNMGQEHICCAISDKKHQEGVLQKKEWLKDRIKEGHVFRKLNTNGKVFIEYAPLENAWVPITGDNYLYIYCLWVAGSYKGNGYGDQLLNYCIEDAKKQNKSGICILSSKKKIPFTSDKKFMSKYGFKVVDETENNYELLALSFDGTLPKFNTMAKKQQIDEKNLTIFYTKQCPYIVNCIKEIQDFGNENHIVIHFKEITSLKQAKTLPCIFNNWAVFLDGKYITNSLLNANMLKKLLDI